MKLLQVYLPTAVTETIEFNGLSQPLLRYYEKLVAVHLTPIFYNEIKRSGFDKFIARAKSILVNTIDELGYVKAAALGVSLALALLGRKNPSVQKFMRKMLKGVGFKVESVDLTDIVNLTEDLERGSGRDKLFTEITIGKDLKIQFIALPISVKDIKQVLGRGLKDNQQLKDVTKSKAFVTLNNIEINDNFDVKMMVYKHDCIICSIEEYETYKNEIDNKQLSAIVVDTVNDVVYAKIYIKGKVFKYSNLLSNIVRTSRTNELSLERLASLLTGLKIAKNI